MSVGLKQLHVWFEGEKLSKSKTRNGIDKWVKPFPQGGGFPAPHAEHGLTPEF